MPRRKAVVKSDDPISNSYSTPPVSDDARVSMLVSLAMDRVEQRLRDGTASSQEIVYYLKLGSERERLEREMMEAKNELLIAKTEAIKAAENTERLYAEAIKAFKLYGGAGEEEEYEDDE